MFQFFKRKGGKAEPESPRKAPTAPDKAERPVDARAPDPDNERTTRKDVVNLLIPETDYNQKTGVGAILQIMAGKRKRGKRKRTESCRVSPPKETQILQRSSSVLAKNEVLPASPARDENNHTPNEDPAEFVKALVLQKYAKTPTENNQHVSLVYVSNEPDLEEKRHAEALLREIARSIDCTVDKLNNEMGTTDSKLKDHSYESIPDRCIDSYKNELKKELNLLTEAEENDGESPSAAKKSNLKPPKSDTEAGSDDDRSDNGRKRVTFRKHIIFDDGEQQTDNEADSSFESLSSEEEYLEEIALDNEHKEFVEDVPFDSQNVGDIQLDNDNKTVININESEPITIKIENSEDEHLVTASSDTKFLNTDKKFQSDNSDSGFLDIGDRNNSGDDLTSVKSEESDSESESEEIIEEIIEEEIEIEELEEEEEEDDQNDDTKTLVQDNNLYSHVAAISELGTARSEEAERARDLVVACRKQLEGKDQEIEQLKCELAAAYKESELIRQRSRSLEEELTAARSCSADLAGQLKHRNEEYLRELRGELEDAVTRRAELESKVLALERDRDRLEREKSQSEQKAIEALEAAEANTAKWRLAHEAARSQAAARAERMLGDCEWKMRELEKRARDAEKENKQLTETVEHLKKHPEPSAALAAELQQLRGLVAEQQRTVQSLTLQLQRVETREEALKLESHRLKDLLGREEKSKKEADERHLQTVQRLEQSHTKSIETLKSEHATSADRARAAQERAHADATRAATARMRADAQRDAAHADRKLRELATSFENLKEVLARKEAQFEAAIVEAHSKADWDILQLRHMLDKADIDYANKVDDMTQRFENEREQLIEEWTKKVKDVEDQAATAADEARRALETTRSKLVAERVEQVNKLKENHRQEMEEQWEQFMTDKENCLSRMKMECRQEGEEERIKREKELLEEIRELKSQIHSKSSDFDNLAVQAAACGRTLAVTEQELREALVRERELREKKSEDATKIKQLEKNSKEQIEHLTRKTACLRKLFDDMRSRLTARERAAELEARAKDKELHQLRGEVARLTKILVEQSSPALGARTRADGCETALAREPPPAPAPAPAPAPPPAPAALAPRRKGRTAELVRKRTCPLPELVSGAGAGGGGGAGGGAGGGRPRARSVDLPAVQVPLRIKQLQGNSTEYLV